MYGQILNVVGPIFVMTFVGYLMGRSKLNLDTSTISSMVLLVATPCLVFSTLTSLDIDGSTVLTMAIAAICCVTLAGLCGLVVLRLAGMSYRTFLPSLMMPNSGNIGLPLALLTFGEKGLALGISFFFVIALLQYTLGIAIASGEYRLRDLARQPLIYSVTLAAVVLLTEIKVPVIIATTTDLLGGMMVPAMPCSCPTPEPGELQFFNPVFDDNNSVGKGTPTGIVLLDHQEAAITRNVIGSDCNDASIVTLKELNRFEGGESLA